MRKSLITQTPKAPRPAAEDWLDLEHAAAVEVTSEEEGFPVESALLLGETRGWRAASSGAQSLRLVFDQPQTLKHISLVFEEEQTERTQEFVLQWSADKGGRFEKLFASSGTSAHPMQSAKSRNISLSCLMSPCLS